MKYNISRTLIVILTFVIAMNFEMALNSRMVMLYVLFSAFIALPFLRGKSHTRFGWSLLVDIGLVFALNIYSRFNINYVFVLLNLWILAEAALWQPLSRAAILTALTFMGSALSFNQSFAYAFNYQLLSQAVFIEVVFALFSGMLFTYKSYTREKERVEKLNETLVAQNEQLILSNQALTLSKEALEEANLEVVRLTRLKERSGFARDLHDTVGHELTGHIMSLEMLKMQAENEEMKHAIQTSVDQSREMLRAMRELVSAHKEIIVHDNLHDALSKKLKQYQTQTGIIVHLNYALFDEGIDAETGDVLYRTVLESITNTAKHSTAKRVWISFQSLEDKQMLLKIVDDGGCNDGYTKGNGLSFIEERIKRISGTVQFECDENGFRTSVKIPGGRANESCSC